MPSPVRTLRVADILPEHQEKNRVDLIEHVV